MGVSGAKQVMSRVPRQAAATAGLPSARTRAALLEYAVEHLLLPGASRDALGRVLERLTSDLGAQAALVVAPGLAQPLGEAGAYPADIRNDLVLLAQIRSAWAAHGQQAAASGQAFTAELDSGRHRAGLLVIPAELADGQHPGYPGYPPYPCAIALIGDTNRWKSGARSTVKAVVTLVAALFMRQPESFPAEPSPPGPVRPRGPSSAQPGLELVRPAPAQPRTLGWDPLARALLAGSPAAVVAVDADRRIREFNPAAEELFGRARAEVIGLDMPGTLVPERLRHQFVDAMVGYLATGDVSGFVRRARLRALRADGTERPIELTALPVTVAGETYFFGFMRDASDLENANMAVAEGDARFRLLSDLAPVAIVQTDVGGACRFVNDKWSELTGMPASEAVGRNWRDTINLEDVRRIDAHRRQDGTGPEVATDCRLRNVSGEETWVHAVVRRVLDHDGQLVGRVAALTDVHDRKRAEAAGEQDRRRLAEQNIELRDLNAARVRYLATVSHELRTPLTSIVSFAELIRTENPGLAADEAEYLDIIQRNAERLLRVVGDLLDLSGLEEGVARLELASISIPQVARESVRVGWSIAAVGGIRLDMSAQDGPDVQADASRLQQVLDNLISNAVKFSAAGGQVDVRATHDNREWRIDVADAGMGIPPSEVDHLFDRFFRASNARRAQVPGTGLGLPTAKAITELHGGRIEVASAVGTGTTVTVFLPILR
jgi:PAS domain S-box-containing protein